MDEPGTILRSSVRRAYEHLPDAKIERPALHCFF